ncbi:Ribosomal protein L7/L12 C-terminal domain-containing protein [Thermomonospora echinospora]|uniref:Ribosomal protein L7/L12 C-terminal domain-containing protein n=1 Tax=Thermomonospora echinospora TaxID=1992 RepID=A0A1H5VTR3_9ACTN|nr:ribosomal protein L7/L12 [Thermomonospora echinospora]SEF89947.1 Ribosomal protein L7/L12 C-terminal domain-containing protein [Thermomonospora echinospora]
MSSTTILILVGLPVGAMMLGFIAITFAAGHAARSSVRPVKGAPGGPPSPEAFTRAQALLDRGKKIEAIKLIRDDTGMGLKEAKDYAEAMQDGRIPGPPAASPHGAGLLSERVRAFRDAGDRDSAVALVQAETGMNREEAVRFVDALD